MAVNIMQGKPGALLTDEFVVSPSRELGLNVMVAEARGKAAAAKGESFIPKGSVMAMSALGLMGALWAFDHSQTTQQFHAEVAGNGDLTQTVKSLKARVEALDAAKSRDETADIRKSVADLKASVASLRDATGSIGAPASRVDKLERDLGKLTDRLDKQKQAIRSDVAARRDHVEKKSAGATAAMAPAPRAGATIAIAPAPQPAISNEMTGSIGGSRPVIREWALLEVHDGVAILEGRDGFRQVSAGDVLPGSGRIEKIERRAHGWAVVTAQGEIVSAPN